MPTPKNVVYLIKWMAKGNLKVTHNLCRHFHIISTTLALNV